MNQSKLTKSYTIYLTVDSRVGSFYFNSLNIYIALSYSLLSSKI